MACTSLEKVELQDHGIVEVRTVELDGITADQLTVKGPVDMEFMLSTLPDGLCQCPHWGIVNKGGFTVRYADREETVRAGDVFHLPPGHVPTYEVGTEMLLFSPTDEVRATDEAIQRGLQALQQS